MSVLGAPDAVRVIVMAADGRRVLEHDLRNGPTWSVGALPTGLYTVQVVAASGAVRSTRVVKQ
jgi:hypothetical protein